MKRIYLAFILLLVLLTSCSGKATEADKKGTTAQPEEDVLVERHKNDCDIDIALASEIKKAFYLHQLSERPAYAYEYIPEKLWISRYEGKIGSCHILILGGETMQISDGPQSCSVAGYELIFWGGAEPYAYHDGDFYFIEEAYKKKLLSEEDIIKIKEVFDRDYEDMINQQHKYTNQGEDHETDSAE